VNEMRRYQFLEDNPAAADGGLFPPEEECPQLADLRAEHERLTVAVGDELKAAGELRRRRDDETEARRAAHEAEFLDGDLSSLPEYTVDEEDVADATVRAEAARDALQSFVRGAVAEVTERAPELLDRLDEVVRAADAKRAEAQAILAEADRLEGETKKMRRWLARMTGDSALGLYPFEQLDVPLPPAPLDLEAVLAGGSPTEVEING
jgi:hypothetical protein